MSVLAQPGCPRRVWNPPHEPESETEIAGFRTYQEGNRTLIGTNAFRKGLTSDLMGVTARMYSRHSKNGRSRGKTDLLSFWRIHLTNGRRATQVTIRPRAMPKMSGMLSMPIFLCAVSAPPRLRGEITSQTTPSTTYTKPARAHATFIMGIGMSIRHASVGVRRSPRQTIGSRSILVSGQAKPHAQAHQKSRHQAFQCTKSSAGPGGSDAHGKFDA